MMRPAILALCALGATLLPQEDKRPEPSATAVVGKPAPAFRLNDHTGKIVAIGGESERWTAVALFPKAATPG